MNAGKDIVPFQDQGLPLAVLMDRARAELEVAGSFEEVKDLRDRTAALRHYARAIGAGRAARNRIAEITLRCERRMGAALLELEKNPGGGDHRSQGGTGASVNRSHRATGLPTYREMGINKSDAARWQTIARAPSDVFEDYLKGGAAHAVELTSKGMVAISRRLQRADDARARPGAVGAAESLGLMIEGGEKFGVILADPPWPHQAWGGGGKDRSAERHYDTMTVEAIAAMDVGALAAADCVLFLWVINPLLIESRNYGPGVASVIRAWGFDYSTVAFTWEKLNADTTPFLGMGKWTRANVELCLLATRGAPVRLDGGVEELIVAPRGAHSAKPGEVHGRIQRLVPGPYLELFARAPRAGWRTWGNEA